MRHDQDGTGNCCNTLQHACILICCMVSLTVISPSAATHCHEMHVWFGISIINATDRYWELSSCR